MIMHTDRTQRRGSTLMLVMLAIGILFVVSAMVIDFVEQDLVRTNRYLRQSAAEMVVKSERFPGGPDAALVAGTQRPGVDVGVDHRDALPPQGDSR